DPGALVAPADRVDAVGHVTGCDVVVGVAQPGTGHLDGQLALQRLGEVEFDDLVGAGRVPQDRTAGLHADHLTASPSGYCGDSAWDRVVASSPRQREKMTRL